MIGLKVSVSCETSWTIFVNSICKVSYNYICVVIAGVDVFSLFFVLLFLPRVSSYIPFYAPRGFLYTKEDRPHEGAIFEYGSRVQLYEITKLGSRSFLRINQTDDTILNDLGTKENISTQEHLAVAEVLKDAIAHGEAILG